MELETCARQKPCSILVFDSGETHLRVSKTTRHYEVTCCKRSLAISRGDPKGEKIQYNQIANVMEFLVQLAKLRDGEGNNVMQNLPMHFDSGEKHLGVSKTTRHVVIDDEVIFSQSIIYVRELGAWTWAKYEATCCKRSLAISWGDPKGEKIQYNQITNVMEFLMQLAKRIIYVRVLGAWKWAKYEVTFCKRSLVHGFDVLLQESTCHKPGFKRSEPMIYNCVLSWPKML
ncbi:hypothetical protein WN943_007895 [Citrus x changshan-huyou]